MSYFRPLTKEEALETMSKISGLMPLAGCTDISVGRQEKKLLCNDFVDLSYINTMRFIKERDGYIYLGAMTTHNDAADSPVIQSRASFLSDACGTVGSPQIRNRGTLGGNINHASPSGDSIPPLMALNGEFLLESRENSRWVKAVDFFTGPGKTVRKPEELLTEIRFLPLTKQHKSFFFKLGQRKSLSCSKVSLAFCGVYNANILSDVRIAMGAVGPTVLRAKKTEAFLEGKKLDKNIIEEACHIITGEASPIDDLRSTAEYRSKMTGILLEKSLASL